jgi:hypothetical protein
MLGRSIPWQSGGRDLPNPMIMIDKLLVCEANYLSLLSVSVVVERLDLRISKPWSGHSRLSRICSRRTSLIRPSQGFLPPCPCHEGRGLS